jgi:hypothetical protein
MPATTISPSTVPSCDPDTKMITPESGADSDILAGIEKMAIVDPESSPESSEDELVQIGEVIEQDGDVLADIVEDVNSELSLEIQKAVAAIVQEIDAEIMTVDPASIEAIIEEEETVSMNCFLKMETEVVHETNEETADVVVVEQSEQPEVAAPEPVEVMDPGEAPESVPVEEMHVDPSAGPETITPEAVADISAEEPVVTETPMDFAVEEPSESTEVPVPDSVQTEAVCEVIPAVQESQLEAEPEVIVVKVEEPPAPTEEIKPVEGVKVEASVEAVVEAAVEAAVEIVAEETPTELSTVEEKTESTQEVQETADSIEETSEPNEDIEGSQKEKAGFFEYIKRNWFGMGKKS